MSYSVLISDPTEDQKADMLEFIYDARLSLVTIDGVDVSDFSLTADVIYEYLFVIEKDALLFRLKYG